VISAGTSVIALSLWKAQALGKQERGRAETRYADQRYLKSRP
jgi:hypothetical protein